MRRLALALCLALPAAAAGQAFTAQPPGLGEGLARLERLRGLRLAPPAAGADGGLRQVYVVPERPGQAEVAWYRLDWQYVDVPAPGGGPGGLRLYYARSAEVQARRALPAIRSAYARLVQEFAYAPTRRIPYILYGNQREFLATNVFRVSEGVLGVTSPEDLKMTVPWFGDQARFLEVSTHELVHQFTIQKLVDAAGGDAGASAVARLPLWFVEGIAEFYTKGGIDPETDEYLRDLVWNPDPARDHQVVAFGEDRLRGYLPTYKLGQARVAFVADAYGREKIQALLEGAGLLGDGRDAKGLDALCRRVLGEPLEQVDTRWRAWLKRRYLPAYGRVRQDLAQVRELRGLPGEPEAAVATADGQVALVRTLDRERGRASLWLADLRNPREALRVADDDVPGSESLHPFDHGVMAIGDGLLAWAAQAGPGDVLTVRRWRADPSAGPERPRVELGEARRLEVRTPEGGAFVRIGDPAFSPGLDALAFVGVAADGQQDVYVAPLSGGAARRLTRDAFAKRDLSWGPEGLYLVSDATDHGRGNLFRLDPASGAMTRLTTWAADDRHPRALPGGAAGAPARVVFSTDAYGKSDLALLEGGAVRRLTDFTTALRWPAAAPDGRGLLAITFHGGLFRLVEVPRAAWLTEPAAPVAPPAGAVLPIPEAPLPGPATPYLPLDLENWRPEGGILYGGGGVGGVAGRAAVLFEDFLRDQSLLVDVAFLGGFDASQALVLYQNRARRNPWSLGFFHVVQRQVDPEDRALEFFQRDFGVAGALTFPLDRYRRLELELAAGGVERYCLTDFWLPPYPACAGYQHARPDAPGLTPPELTAAWRAANGGLHLQLGPTVRLGYDTVRLDPLTGPLDGAAVLAELGGGWLPGLQAVHGFTRLEASRWWQLVGRVNLMARLAGAATFAPDEAGRRWQRTWWLSPADNLRGYLPTDDRYLIGRNYYVANLELQVPLDGVLRLPFLDLEGVAALDFGGTFDQPRSSPASPPPGQPCAYATTGAPQACLDPGAWDARTLTGVLGVNALLGPILVRVHFGHPFDVGGMATPALRAGSSWVTNVTLRYFFF